MTSILLFILVIAFMFFLHRTRGSEGASCCAGHVHDHEPQNQASFNRHGTPKTKPSLSDVEEVEYELLEE